VLSDVRTHVTVRVCVPPPAMQVLALHDPHAEVFQEYGSVISHWQSCVGAWQSDAATMLRPCSRHVKGAVLTPLLEPAGHTQLP